MFEFDDPRVPELREQFFAAVKPTSAAAVFDPTLTCGEIVLQLDESLGPDQAVAAVLDAMRTVEAEMAHLRASDRLHHDAVQ
ncbi:MAG: hypothetical protein ABMA25_26570 [Ilumatobacteraceae bacterium]